MNANIKEREGGEGAEYDIPLGLLSL